MALTISYPAPTAAHVSCSAASPRSSAPSPPSLLKNLKLPRFWPWQKVELFDSHKTLSLISIFLNWEFQIQVIVAYNQVKVGPLSVSPMGFGTWAWGNQLLWGYQESMDAELQQIFNLALENGINLFDTADSYGTGRLNGQSERLLGKFIQEFPGSLSLSLSLGTVFRHYFVGDHLFPSE